MKKFNSLFLSVFFAAAFCASATTYTITTAEEWNALAQKMAADSTTLAGDVVYIANDIDFAGDTILPLGYDLVTLFDGELDGNGKTISGYVAESTAQYYGAIATNTGTSTYIHDLTIDGALTSAYSYTGGVVGRLSYGTIEDVVVKGSVTTTNTYTGGVVGYSNNATIKRCANTGTVTSTKAYAAGITSRVWNATVIDSCYNSGAVQGLNYVGGITSYMSTNGKGGLKNSYNTGSVTSTSTSTNSYTAGIVGYNPSLYDTIMNVFNIGDITASATNYTGGIMGSGTSSIINAYNMGSVAGVNYVGGISGQHGQLSYCYNAGTVTGTSTYVSAVNGACSDMPTYCYYLESTATGGMYEAMVTSVTQNELAALDLGDNWVAGDDYTYPRLVTLAANPYAQAYAAQAIPRTISYRDAMGNTTSYTDDPITGNFYVGCPDDVMWTASPDVITLDGNTASFTKTCQDTLTMTATCGDVAVSTRLACNVTVEESYDTTYWLSGGYNSWITSDNDAYGFTNNGDGTHTLKLDEFYGEFKIITEGGEAWYGYGTIDLDTEYTITTSGGNISLPSATDTYTGVTFTLNDATEGTITLKVSAEGQNTTAVTYYLVGDSPLAWSASDDYAFTANSDDTYVLTTASEGFTTSMGMKVLTSTSLWLGYASYNIDYGTSYELTTSGNNFYLNTAPSTDALTFTLTVNDGAYYLVVTDSGESGIDGIDEDDRTVIAEKFYTLDGAQVTEPADGGKAIYIVTRTYSDGSVETAKEVR